MKRKPVKSAIAGALIVMWSLSVAATPTPFDGMIEHARYLGALPGGGRKERFVDPGIRPPSGMVRKTVSGGTEPRTVTMLEFHGSIDPTRENQWNVHALAAVLQLRLMERLRQQMSGTYSVQVQADVARIPTPQYSLTINFVSAPDRADELTRATLAVLDSAQRAPARDADVRALRSARRIVATSGWTRSELLERDAADAHDIVVAHPGVDQAPATEASGSGGRLLCVAAVAPHKGQDLLVRALIGFADRDDWTCRIVGSLQVDPDFVDAGCFQELNFAFWPDQGNRGLIGPQ